ncbi:MAG: SpoIID/LytB domain-containing protein [Clostridiales bacterium]|nr:SpoIID/LytB domain-containing protein [Clostridiales bacterium]
MSARVPAVRCQCCHASALVLSFSTWYHHNAIKVDHKEMYSLHTIETERGKCMDKRIKQLLVIVLSVVLLATAALGTSFAEDGIPMAATAVDPVIQVYLSRLALTDRLDITLTTPYGLTFGSEGAELYAESGSKLAFILWNDAIYLYMDGLSLRLGKAVELRRCEGGGDEKRPGFYRTGFEPLYLGDLKLTINEGKLYPVLSIHVEDYLLGVVPYEMSDSFPLEALKAQTIAARTYVLRKAAANKAYDVVDTTNDQVFRGYVPGFANAERAVSETRGVCGFYKGKLAQCYYAASNGGQTELVQTVWPTDEDFGYYAAVRDPYDVENPASTVRSLAVKKAYEAGETAPYALRKLLAQLLADKLTEMGYDPAPESILVHRVSDVAVDTPSFEGSLLMKRLLLTVEVSGRTRTEWVPQPLLTDPDTEEVFLFETPSPTVAEEQPTATPEPTPAPPTPTPAPVYGEFERIEEPFVLSAPIFKTVENAFGMNISGNFDNEIWSVAETETGYEVQARRYGHGVGMSQRGAEQMAGSYEKDFREILAFYYPGMELMRYDVGEAVLMKAEPALSATAGPAPTVTPRPTLMPVTTELQPGQWYAAVTEIDDDSSLNLRSRPDLGGEILMRLYKHQRLLVLERCPEEGWVHVKTDSIEGYVMESYLTNE